MTRRTWKSNCRFWLVLEKNCRDEEDHLVVTFDIDSKVKVSSYCSNQTPLLFFILELERQTNECYDRIQIDPNLNFILKFILGSDEYF